VRRGEIDPDPAVLGRTGLAIDHPALQLGGAADRVDDAREFRQHPIAGRRDDAPGMFADLRVDELAAMRCRRSAASRQRNEFRHKAVVASRRMMFRSMAW
jgi:hypothetical protein